MQYVEVCELLAGAEERYFMKQLAICFVTCKRDAYGGKFSL